jgi:hypothetical protein
MGIMLRGGDRDEDDIAEKNIERVDVVAMIHIAGDDVAGQMSRMGDHVVKII